MKRDYNEGVKDDVTFFVGTEIEKTPAYGMETLFVVGIHDPETVSRLAEEKGCKHIFVGANHSFNPESKSDPISAIGEWDRMIIPLLQKGYLVSLDFDVRFIEDVLESGYNEYDNFIPQISVKVPYIKQFNYNAMLKIDDKDFRASNPGVWCHRLHELMDQSVFTDWNQYGNDEPL